MAELFTNHDADAGATTIAVRMFIESLKGFTTCL